MQFDTNLLLTPHLSTAWMPLEGPAEQWGHIGAEATTVSLLHATSAAFAALRQETTARQQHREAWYGSHAQDVNPFSLEQVLACLHDASAAWTQAILAFEPSPLDGYADERECDLLVQAMHERLRVSILIQEVAHEQLIAVCPEILTLGRGQHRS